MTEAIVPKQFHTLVFKAVNVWGKTEYYCQQYKIVSYTHKTSHRGFGCVTIECPRYWVAYYVLPPRSWGNNVVNRHFATPKDAMRACQIAWEHTGWGEVDINAHGVKCYESLRDKHEKLNKEREQKKKLTSEAEV